MSGEEERLQGEVEGKDDLRIEGIRDTKDLSFEEAVREASPALEGFDIEKGIKANLEKARSKDRLGLSIDQAAAIALYTDEHFYLPLNRVLREKDHSALRYFFPFIKLLLSALYKLQPQGKLVFRGIREDKKPLPRYQVGQRVTWWSFTSTSVFVTKVENFLKNDQRSGPTHSRQLFVAQIHCGFDISHYSWFPENELLLLPGTQMEVTGVLDARNGLTIIQMDQVSDVELIDFPPPPSVKNKAKALPSAFKKFRTLYLKVREVEEHIQVPSFSHFQFQSN